MDLLQPWHLIVLAIFVFPMFAFLAVLPFWFICKKAGFSPWLSLISILPFGPVILTFVLAFSDWKVVPVPQAIWGPQLPYPPQPSSQV